MRLEILVPPEPSPGTPLLLHKGSSLSCKKIHLKLQKLQSRVRERSAEGGGGKSTDFSLLGRPHPVPLLASSTSGMPPPRLPAPHRVSPILRKPQGEARQPPAPHTHTLRPEPSGEWQAKSTVSRGTLCNSVAGSADRRVEPIPLRASRGPHRRSLPAPRSAPQPRGHSGRLSRAPLTWAGHLPLRASPEAELPGWAGWGFYTHPILPEPGCPASPPSLACSHPLGDSLNLERSPSPVLPYVTAPPPPRALQASAHPPAPNPLLLGYLDQCSGWLWVIKISAAWLAQFTSFAF